MRNLSDTGQLIWDTVGLIWDDPMLTPDSTGTLQAGSPLIDAGNPAVFDLDGSRSDVGLYGGPGGSPTPWVNFAPSAPASLWLDTAGGFVDLAWGPNPEADLAGYRIYRDNHPRVLPGGWNRLKEIPAAVTQFRDEVDAVPAPRYYYVVTAFDTQGYEGPPSAEVVYPPKAAPEITPLEPQSVAEGERLVLTINASDANGDALTLWVHAAPDNSTFTDHGDGTGTFQFNPSYSQAGDYVVRFTAWDADLGDTIFVEISVTDAVEPPENMAPEITPLEPQSVAEGDSLVLSIDAFDPNGDDLSLWAIAAPDNSTFTDHGDGTGTFQFNPSYSQAGDYQVRFTAWDADLGDTIFVEISVTDAVEPPLPRTPRITRVYPNPFNASTVVEYGIPDVGVQPARVGIRVYNTLGALVATLYDGDRSPGRYQVTWNGSDSSGASVSSGVYFIRMFYWSRPKQAYKVVLLK